jgi:hypothetical protein
MTEDRVVTAGACASAQGRSKERSGLDLPEPAASVGSAVACVGGRRPADALYSFWLTGTPCQALVHNRIESTKSPSALPACSRVARQHTGRRCTSHRRHQRAAGSGQRCPPPPGAAPFIGGPREGQRGAQRCCCGLRGAANLQAPLARPRQLLCHRLMMMYAHSCKRLLACSNIQLYGRAPPCLLLRPARQP